MVASLYFFSENEEFWDKCDDKLCSGISEQLVYYFIKDSLKNQSISISSKYVRFSDGLVTIVKVNDSTSINYYVVRKDDDYRIIVDKIIPSYRKRYKLFLNVVNDRYKKPIKHSYISFLEKFNVVRVFKQE